MNTYHKIQTVFLRDPATNMKTLLEGQFALPEFEYLQHNEWVFTEKVDGTNIRVIYDAEQLTFKGKTDNAQIPTFLYGALEEIFMPQWPTFKKLFGTEPAGEDKPVSVCLYGEGYGPKIQKGGGNYREDNSFVLFDIRIGPWWLKRTDVLKIAQDLKLDAVPELCTGTLHEMVDMCKVGFNSQWGDFRAEGIVAKPVVDLLARNGNRIVTKLKCKDFQHDH